MLRFSFSSLRFRLLLLVLIATTPALGLILYSDWENLQRERAKVQKNALQLAQIAVNNQDPN